MNNVNDKYFEKFCTDMFCHRTFNNELNYSLNCDLDIIKECNKIIKNDKSELINLDSELYKNNKYIHLAIVNSKNPDLDLIDNIAKSLLKEIKKDTNLIQLDKQFLFKALELDIPLDTKTKIMKKCSKYLL